MTDVSLDQLVADAIRATGLHQKDKAIEEMVRLQLHLKGQKEAIEELWGSFQWQGDLDNPARVALCANVSAEGAQAHLSFAKVGHPGSDLMLC